MLTYFEEKALGAYFSAEAVTKRFTNVDLLFKVYCNIFLLSPDSVTKLRVLLQNEELNAIESEKDYYRYCRINQYNAMKSVEKGSNNEIDEAISLKYRAFMALNEMSLVKDSYSAKSVVCDCLIQAADAGHIFACYTLGILQCEGIMFDKDPEAGRSRLHKAATWNNIEGLFAALYYAHDDANKDRYLTGIYKYLSRTCRARLFETISAVYGHCSGRKYDEIDLLEKAFDQGKIKREMYSKPYARLLFSEVLSKKDKSAFIFTGNKELFEDICSLPIKLSGDQPKILYDTIDSSIISDHAQMLNEKLRLVHLRRSDDYKPICIVSDSKLVLNYCCELFAKSLSNAHVERIDVADLGEMDFEPTQNNIFVRNCDEDLFNAYFIFFEGDIKEKVCDKVTIFLQSGKRAKYRLNRPSTILDLSSILPICFADKENAKRLKPYCNVIEIAELSKSAKMKFIDHIISVKCKVYGLDEIKISKEAKEHLCEYGIDKIGTMITEAVDSSHESKLILTQEKIRSYMQKHSSRSNYGFGGGSKNENVQ